MNEAYPKLSGWVGYGNGLDIMVREGEPVDSRHPAVVERPDLFNVSDDEPKRVQARPAARKTGTVT